MVFGGILGAIATFFNFLFGILAFPINVILSLIGFGVIF